MWCPGVCQGRTENVRGEGEEGRGKEEEGRRREGEAFVHRIITTNLFPLVKEKIVEVQSLNLGV